MGVCHLEEEKCSPPISIQKSIIEMGKTIIDNKQVISHRQVFKYVQFDIGSREIFRRVLVLRRWGSFPGGGGYFRRVC